MIEPSQWLAQVGLTPATTAIVFAALAFGGFVKGCVGIGQPTATFLITANFVSPFTAIAANTLPMVAANWLQAREAPSIMVVIRNEARVLFGLILGLGIGATLLPYFRESWVLVFIGLIIGLFCLTELVGFSIAEIKRPTWGTDLAAGISAGIIGGLTTLWAAPLLIYYAARRIEKDAFVQTVGVVLLVGAVTIAVLYLANGILSGERLALSLFGAIPAMAGFLLGQKVRKNLSAAAFRRLLLAVFMLGGLVIMGRGFVAL